METGRSTTERAQTGTGDSEVLVYGPVHSRRLGRSLGVDLVPFKTCTYDCVYCQLGRTTCRTCERARWVEPSDVLDRVAVKLDTAPDVVALAGSGEPTLHAGLGEVIRGIKAITDVPVAVITNGSLLGRPDVRQDLVQADIVLPSLDAFDETSYQSVNRPCDELDFPALVNGMVSFGTAFHGSVWLEVMLLEGLTDSAESVALIADLAAHIRPDRIQLNTVVRPPAASSARPVAPERLAALAARFTPPAEVIARPPAPHMSRPATAEDVLSLIMRRPCTAADVAAGLGIHHNEALKELSALVERGRATVRTHGGDWFYVGADREGGHREAR